MPAPELATDLSIPEARRVYVRVDRAGAHRMEQLSHRAGLDALVLRSCDVSSIDLSLDGAGPQRAWWLVAAAAEERADPTVHGNLPEVDMRDFRISLEAHVLEGVVDDVLRHLGP
jgi:hypothetical protein